MTTILLGSSGMLGHLTGCLLKEKYGAQAILCARQKTGHPHLDENLYIIDLKDSDAVTRLIEQRRPCVVVNCAAVNNPSFGEEALRAVNSILPRTIESLLARVKDNSRLIHVSTDGVFRGDKGNYSEDDAPDVMDLYGVSKKNGEVTAKPHLTIRTSIIGPDPFHNRGLLDWAFSQRQEIKGYSRVYWSGVTTLALAHFILTAIEREYTGLYHLSSSRISKYELLRLMNKVFKLNLTIKPDDAMHMDRSLVSRRQDIAYVVPPLEAMMEELKSWIMRHPEYYSKYCNS